LFTRRNKEQTGVADALERAFSDAGLRRIALIVRGVDCENCCLDALEARRRIIVARRVVLVDAVIGVGVSTSAEPLIDDLFAPFPGRRELLNGDRAAAGRETAERAG